MTRPVHSRRFVVAEQGGALDKVDHVRRRVDRQRVARVAPTWRDEDGHVSGQPELVVGCGGQQ